MYKKKIKVKSIVAVAFIVAVYVFSVRVYTYAA